MPRLAVLLLSLMLGAGCAVLVSCGGSDEPEGPGIPTADAEGMLNELEIARSALAEGDCAEVGESAADIEASALNLDGRIDAKIQDGLEQGAARLAELAADAPECEEQTTTTTTEPEKTEPTTTSTTTATPTTTEEPTTTTTTEEPPPEEEEEEDPASPGQPPGPPQGVGPGTGGTGDGD